MSTLYPDDVYRLNVWILTFVLADSEAPDQSYADTRGLSGSSQSVYDHSHGCLAKFCAVSLYYCKCQTTNNWRQNGGAFWMIHVDTVVLISFFVLMKIDSLWFKRI